jgi:hypothetical protein
VHSVNELIDCEHRAPRAAAAFSLLSHTTIHLIAATNYEAERRANRVYSGNADDRCSLQ